MGRKSILFVDDSSFLRRRLEEALDEGDYNVVSVKDGREALDWVRNNPPVDLVITDLYMPNLDGIGLIARLRAHSAYRRTPIFVLTSGTDPSEKEHVRNAGATAWIVKPFDRTKLVNAIQRVVQ